MEKSNADNDTSATFLRNLNKLAIYLTSQSPVGQKVFRKQNIALAILKKSNGFSLIAKDKDHLLDIESFDGEITDPLSLAKVFVSESLIQAGSNEVYVFVFISGLLFSESLTNETVQSVSCLLVFLRERYTIF